MTLRTDTERAEIRYTVDGCTPSAIRGWAYDGFPLTVSSSVTIRTVAWKDGWADSPVASVTCTLAGTAEVPAFSPDAGNGPAKDRPIPRPRGQLGPLGTVDDAGVTGLHASLVETGAGLAVGCCDSLAGDLRLAAWDGSGWTLRQAPEGYSSICTLTLDGRMLRA